MRCWLVWAQWWICWTQTGHKANSLTPRRPEDMEVCIFSVLQISNFPKISWLVRAGIHTFFNSKPAGQIVHRLLWWLRCTPCSRTFKCFSYCAILWKKKMLCLSRIFSSLYSFLSVWLLYLFMWPYSCCLFVVPVYLLCQTFFYFFQSF